MVYFKKYEFPRIVYRDGTPLSIILDRGAQFTSRFLSPFHKGLGTKVKLSTTLHPQMDGQLERTIETVELCLELV